MAKCKGFQLEVSKMIDLFPFDILGPRDPGISQKALHSTPLISKMSFILRSYWSTIDLKEKTSPFIVAVMNYLIKSGDVVHEDSMIRAFFFKFDS